MTGYVVGVDGSGPSDAALKWALGHAAVEPGPLLLVHVIDDEWGVAGSDYAREAMIAGQYLLQRARDRTAVLSGSPPGVSPLDADSRIATRIVHGSPVWELAAVCGDDELLVIGTHKTGYLHGRVLGSRSVAIAAIAAGSVVVVPDSPSSRRHGVVAGVTGADSRMVGVARAAREAERLQETLLVIHAAPSQAVGVTDESMRQRQREVLRAAVRVATTAAPHVSITTRVSTRQPAEALLDASRDATMLVLEPSRNRDQRSILGSTTHDVLMNINVPVMIARGAPDPATPPRPPSRP